MNKLNWLSSFITKNHDHINYKKSIHSMIILTNPQKVYYLIVFNAYTDWIPFITINLAIAIYN